MKQQNLLFKTPGSRDITIGVVCPFFWENSALNLYHGITDAAERNGINLLLYQGFYCSEGSFTHENYTGIEAIGDIVYDLITNDTIDGLILYTGGLKKYAFKKRIVDMCSRYKPKPMLSIGAAVEGVPNILIDNINPIKSIMDHLVLKHNRRKIAFIRGPLDNADSNERFETYLSMLNKYSIIPDPEWIRYSGVFDRISAIDAARKLIEATHGDIDAILFINDKHASGVIEELDKKGILVPEQVSVIGFNNDAIADVSYPGITSIDRNLYGRGARAVKIISDQLNGIPIKDSYIVEAQTIMRQSCGCLSVGTNAIESVFKIRSDHKNISKVNKLDKTALSAEIFNDAITALQAPKNDRLFTLCKSITDSFIAEVTGTDNNGFLLKFNDIIHQSIQLRFNLQRWFDVLNVLDLSIENLASPSDLERHRIIISKARVYLSEAIEQILKADLIRIEERNTIINSLNHAFNTTNELSSILDLLARDLPKIGITSCYLSVYEDPLKPTEYSNLLLAFSRSGKMTIPEGGVRFLSSQLIPESFIPLSQQKSLVLEPLYYGEHQIGFVLFEIGTDDGSFYELFPAQLSAALWGSNLKNKVFNAESALKTKSDALAQSNEALHDRAAELETAYERLKSNQDKLHFSDKMASLGKLTAGIAHEMNTPLATVRASIGELEGLLHEYRTSIHDPDITMADHDQIADDILKALDLAEKSADHAATFITSIKAQSRDTKGTENQSFNIYQIVENVLIFLSHTIRHSNCKTQIICDHKELELSGSPTKMTQVITNLITNAIDASENSENKLITIDITSENNLITIKVIDNGCGIPESDMPRIFEPLFTTKSFEKGTGLGLPIVKDIIQDDFKGTITVESTPGKGTSFIVKIGTDQELLNGTKV